MTTAVLSPSQAAIASASLSIDFTTAALDSRITFTRTGATATRVNSSGYIETVAADTARFDYNPITLACKGLLIEGSATNSLEYSEAFTAGTWAYTGASAATRSVAAPNNTTSTIELVEDSANSQHKLVRTKVSLSAGSYTLSVYAKKNTRQYLVLSESASTANRALFDLNAGTVAASAGTPNATITAAGNGWYRCTISATIPAGLSFGCTIALSTGALAFPAPTYQGDGTSGLYIWGCQFESGGVATSYIPNTGNLTTTRNPDVAVMTGTNFSDWYNAGKGTFLVSADNNVAGTNTIICADDNTTNNTIIVKTSTTTPTFAVISGGVSQASVTAGTSSANTAFSRYASFAANYFGISGTANRQIATSGTVPTVDRLRIGVDPSANYLFGHIQTLKYWK